MKKETMIEKIYTDLFVIGQRKTRFLISDNCYLYVEKCKDVQFYLADTEGEHFLSRILNMEIAASENVENILEAIEEAIDLFIREYPGIRYLYEKPEDIEQSTETEDKNSKPDEEKPTAIEIPLYNGTALVAEMNLEKDFREIFVGIKKGKTWFQDLACIREMYHWATDPYGDEYVPDHGKYEVLVWGDPENEDYTNRFEIGEYRFNPMTVLTPEEKRAYSDYLKHNFEKLYKEFQESQKGASHE